MAISNIWRLSPVGLSCALALGACVSTGVNLQPQTEAALRSAALSRAIEAFAPVERCAAADALGGALASANLAQGLVAQVAKGIGELKPSERHLLEAVASEIGADLRARASAEQLTVLDEWRAALGMAVEDAAPGCEAKR